MDVQADFRRRGYAMLPDPVGTGELEALRTAADALMAEPTAADGGNHDINRGADRQFLHKRHADFPEVERFLFSDRMRAVTSIALDDPHLFNEQFVVKGPHTGASFAWHQDGAYVPFAHKPYLSVWIALDDATLENGSLSCLPRDLDREGHIDPHHWNDIGKEKVGYDGPDPGEALPCPAGTMVIFSSLTLHRSGANTTNRPRRAYLAQYSDGPILDPSTGNPRNFATPFT
ncbi:phytanoyl-CoA dioxygenase family protein [Jannaschia sp. CCS1]|uniref:phytanoyl-CoA dioxygenase family protein n=1 Tax=Jannaschia sp. (strain CCS1) TaxID=290400 RepID=UPI000053D7E1|nr:phytanoyl-CoA dioxygenase family protein [Jannaschia sp. CCS1]ABD53867.1 Phytanoyl-CoA dioxygenase [Jannaschia sp. CCS1]